MPCALISCWQPARGAESLRRRRERLERRLEEARLLRRGAPIPVDATPDLDAVAPEDPEDLEDAPAEEVEVAEEELVDQASAARTITELEAEIGDLTRLETLAQRVRRSGTDKKWEELSRLLQDAPEMVDRADARRKLVIFTEHRDTLTYLAERIQTLLGRSEAGALLEMANQTGIFSFAQGVKSAQPGEDGHSPEFLKRSCYHHHTLYVTSRDAVARLIPLFERARDEASARAAETKRGEPVAAGV